MSERPVPVSVSDLSLDAVLPNESSRPPVLMIHGIMGGAWYFAKWMQVFAANGYPSYALNLRGHHGSRPVNEFGRVSMSDYVADAHDAVSSIQSRHDGRAPIVLGHSMGSLVAQKVAESFSLAALVLVSAVPPRGILLTSWPLIRREIKHVPAMLLSREINPKPEDTYAVFFNRLSIEEARALESKWIPASGRAARDITLGRVAVDEQRVSCPVLVVAGADDVGTPVRVQRRIARKYGAEYRVFPGHAHFLVWERGCHRVAEEIVNWLNLRASSDSAERDKGHVFKALEAS